MSNLRYFAYAAFLLVSVSSYATAFNPSPWSNRRGAMLYMCPDREGQEGDPTKVWYASLANTVQNALTNSPLNEGKKALVRSLAGNYDRDLIRSKLMALIDGNSVLMLSFVK